MTTQYQKSVYSIAQVKIHIFGLWLLLLSGHVSAESLSPQSVSTGSNSNLQTSEERHKVLSTLDLNVLKENTVTREKRQQTILENYRGKALKQAKTPLSNTQNSYNPYHEFEFYQAQSFLLNDNDFDGYFHSFSIIFDADFYPYDNHNDALVYGEIYISQNGGPWLHLYSTEEFTIFGASTEDEFEVITRLANGYETDHYDILIDLYEVGYTDIVATISSDDTNELYALPLESEDYDIEQVYVEEITIEVYESHGGSMSFLFFFLLSFSLAVRSFKRLKILDKNA